jgi:hypothetical protein
MGHPVFNPITAPPPTPPLTGTLFHTWGGGGGHWLLIGSSDNIELLIAHGFMNCPFLILIASFFVVIRFNFFSVLLSCYIV